MNVRELCIYIRNYLFDFQYFKWIPFLVISALVFGMLAVLHYLGYIKQKEKKRKTLGVFVLLSFEIAVIIVTTLVRESGIERIEWELQPFASYVKAFREKSMGMTAQILMNIFMYTPLGFLLPYCFESLKKCGYVILVALVCSGSIELIQGFFGLGLFETDDILNNVLGAGLGVMLYKVMMQCIYSDEKK